MKKYKLIVVLAGLATLGVIIGCSPPRQSMEDEILLGVNVVPKPGLEVKQGLVVIADFVIVVDASHLEKGPFAYTIISDLPGDLPIRTPLERAGSTELMVSVGTVPLAVGATYYVKLFDGDEVVVSRPLIIKAE